MPFCPLCRIECAAPATTCGSCESDLVDALEPEVEAPLPEPPLALLVRSDAAAAGVIEAALLEKGIATLIEPIQVFTFTSLNFVRIYVSKSRGEEAVQLLEALRQRFPRMPLDYTGASESPPAPGF